MLSLSEINLLPTSQLLIFDPGTLSGGKTATQNHFRDGLTFANFEWSPPQQIFKSNAEARFIAFTFVLLALKVVVKK